MEDRGSGRPMSDKNNHVDGRQSSGAATTSSGSHHEKRRLMLTQLLRGPVLNPAGDGLGRLEALLVKLDDAGGYPPVTGVKVRIGGRDVFVSSNSIEKVAPGEVRLNTQTLDTGAFQRRPGEVPLAADALARKLVGLPRGRLAQ